MVQFIAQRLMEMDVEERCGAGYDGKNPEQLKSRNGGARDVVNVPLDLCNKRTTRRLNRMQFLQVYLWGAQRSSRAFIAGFRVEAGKCSRGLPRPAKDERAGDGCCFDNHTRRACARARMVSVLRLRRQQATFET